jgi:hypothetical protein
MSFIKIVHLIGQKFDPGNPANRFNPETPFASSSNEKREARTLRAPSCVGLGALNII